MPLSPFSSAQVYNEDFSKLQKKNMFRENKVWMVYGWTFLYPKGEQEKKGRKSSFERFDRSGFRSEEVYYDAKAEPAFSCQYLHDDNGNEIKRMGAQGDEIIYNKWNYTVLDHGRMVEKKSEYRKGKDEKWVFSLDAQQNISEEQYYDINGSNTTKWEFSYDARQNVTQKKEMDPYGNVAQKWEYSYDGSGNNVETRHYISGTKLDRIYQMRYDKKGNMKSKFMLDKDENILELTIYVYQFYDGLHAPRLVGNKI